MTWYVYKITCLPTSQVYCGHCKDIDARWGAHQKAARDGVTKPLYQLIREHGVGKFTVDAIGFYPSRHLASKCERQTTSEIAPDSRLNVGRVAIWDRPAADMGLTATGLIRQDIFCSPTPKLTREQYRKEYWRKVRAGEIEPPLDWSEDRIVGPGALT